MKFLGQYIQDFISRFRNDVYLEDVSSGTIASGGNLGLDSNNKIVKASEPASHDAVTLTGTPDYITISGQEITRNQIDLANDVTGTLASGNVATLNQNTTGTAAGLSSTLAVTSGGTGVTSLTDNAVLLGNGSGAIEASAHLTYSNFAPGGGVDIDQLTIGDASSTAGQVLTPGTIPMTVGPSASSGSNVAGANLTLQGGQSTGNTAGGSISFLSSATGGSSNSNPNSTREIAAFDNDGNLQLDGGITTGSTSFVNSSGVIQVATQGTIDHDSLANFVAAEHYRWDTDISGTATINAANIPTLNQNTTGSSATLTTARALQVTLSETDSANFDGSAAVTDIGVTGTLAVGNGGTGLTSISTLLNSNVTQICTTHHNMSLDGGSSTADFYFPINSLADGSSSSLYYTRVLPAYDGKIVKILFRGSNNMGSSCVINMSRRAHDGTSTSHQTSGFQATETFNGATKSTVIVPCGVGGSNASDWVFEEGDQLGFSLVKNTSSTSVDLVVTIVYEYTIS